MAETKSTIFILPCIHAIHLTPMLDFAALLLRPPSGTPPLSSSVTILVIPSERAAAAVAAASAEITATGQLDISFLTLPPAEPLANFDGIEDLFSSTIALYAPAVKAAVAGSPVPVAALVLDMFATTVTNAARELGLPVYVYFPSSSWLFSVIVRTAAVGVETDDGEGVLSVPGLRPIPASAIPDCFVRKNNKAREWFEYHAKRYMEADGVIFNHPAELTPAVLEGVGDGARALGRQPPAFYTVGPLSKLQNQENASHQKHECIEWLDGQPARSVVFLYFGSLRSFDAPQVHEVAAGLERSGHRFLWVLGAVKGTDAPLSALPDGFIERTKGRGMVWPSSAPPEEATLSHGAVGSFLSPGVWESALESMWFGVPVIWWPLFGDEVVNAVVMSAELGNAVVLKENRDERRFVDAGELERGVRRVMDPESGEAVSVRAKAGELKEALRKAEGKDGSSTASFRRLIGDIEKAAGRHANGLSKHEF